MFFVLSHNHYCNNRANFSGRDYSFRNRCKDISLCIHCQCQFLQFTNSFYSRTFPLCLPVQRLLFYCHTLLDSGIHFVVHCLIANLFAILGILK